MSRETETGLAWVHVPEEDEVPEDVSSLWRRADEKLGFVPNVLRTWALRPEHMLRWRKYMDELLKGESGLTEAQREMVGVVVSSTNRCYYCMTSHSGVLRALTQIVDQRFSRGAQMHVGVDNRRHDRLAGEVHSHRAGGYLDAGRWTYLCDASA